MMAGLFYDIIRGDRDFAFVVLFTLQPLFGAAWEGNFLCWRGKITYLMWPMFCFLLQSSYLCTFLSELTVPSTADTIKSLDDLLKTVLPVHSGLQVDTQVLPFAPAQSESLLRKVHVHRRGNFDTLVQTNRHDIAYVVPRYIFQRLFLKMPYRVLPGASINAATASFRLNKPSPYERFFEIAFMRVLDAGAFDKVIRNLNIYDYLFMMQEGVGPPIEDTPNPLPLKSFEVLFSVWFFGCILAVISFVIEICLRYNH